MDMSGRNGGRGKQSSQSSRRNDYRDYSDRSVAASLTLPEWVDNLSSSGSYSDAFTAMAYSHKEQFDQSDQANYKPLDYVSPSKEGGHSSTSDHRNPRLLEAGIAVGSPFRQPFASFHQQMEDMEEGGSTEMSTGPYQGIPTTLGQAKTPESDDGSHEQSEQSETASANQPPFTEVSHYVNPADTSSLGVNQSMDTGVASDDDAENATEDNTAVVYDTTNDPPTDTDFLPLAEDEFPPADDVSETTQPQSNSEPPVIPPNTATQDNDADDTVATATMMNWKKRRNVRLCVRNRCDHVIIAMMWSSTFPKITTRATQWPF
jgi:hypothetical protein